VITTGVTSTLGAPLGQGTQVTFTTGSQPGALASLSVSPGTVLILAGGTVQLIAEPKDAAGNVLAGVGTVSWATDSGHVTVSQSGLLTGATLNAVDGVTATLGAFTARVYPVRVVPPSNVSIAGTWDWTELVSDASAGITCADTGTYVFSQVGAGLAGTKQQVGKCTGPNGTVDNSGSVPVLDGFVGGGNIVFYAFSSGLGCGVEYSASVSGTAPTSLSGTVPFICGNLPGSGTWRAVRRP
jgi:hypothetical protein